MKKVIVSLLVLALAATSVFAGVDFSGSFTTGYVFNYNKDANEWTNYIFGDDNTDTNQTTLNLGFGDENGIWTVNLEGELTLDGTNFAAAGKSRVAGDITIDLAKLIMGDTDWTAQIQLLANDRITALRAYTNKSGLNYDRVRTAEPGLWANAIVGYGDLLQVQIGGAPALTAGNEGGADGLVSADVTDDTGDVTGTAHQVTTGDFIVSAMTKPLAGLAVSVDWALVGENATTGLVVYDSNGQVVSRVPASDVKDHGAFGAAVDVNIAELLGLDFNIGVGVADKYYYGAKVNTLAAQVYGGFDLLQAYVEYVYENNVDVADSGVNRLHFGIDLNVVENLILNVYAGCGDLGKKTMDDNYYVGGNVGYEVGGVTFQLNLQYDEGGYMASKGGDVSNGAVKATGFSITPMVKVSF